MVGVGSIKDIEDELDELAELLPSTPDDVEAGTPRGRPDKLPDLVKEMTWQARLWVPLSVGLVANYLLSVVSLFFVGHLGTQELAAAALATTLYNMTAKICLAGMLGALDTYASQAVGARNYAALASMFRQAVLFLMLHSIPIAGVFISLPWLLRRLGQPEELTRLLGPYLLALLPGVWIDAVYRPFNRILVAQHVTLPQMWISCAVAVQHVGACHLLIHKAGLGYVGAAWATVWSSLLAALGVALYVQLSGLHTRVWTVSGPVVLQSWGPYMKLSYSACAMRAIESWSLSLCSIAAGWLPDPSTALAAMAVAFSVYGAVNMLFGSMAMAACTRVGNGLGAGSTSAAKLSALAAAVSVPPLWSLLALGLTVPASQRALIDLFTDQADAEAMRHMCHLLSLLAILLLFDMSQSVMSGVASGAGKQTKGFAINTLAHWGLALPSALLLGFHFKMGVEGLYTGVVLGPVMQWLCYSVLIWRLDWHKEAEMAHTRLLLATESVGGAGI